MYRQTETCRLALTPRAARLQIYTTEKQKAWYHFITTLCAIVVSAVLAPLQQPPMGLREPWIVPGSKSDRRLQGGKQDRTHNGSKIVPTAADSQGGVFVVAGMVDGLLHSGHRLLAKKLELGKQG